MKKFKIKYKIETTELSKEYGSIDTYYDVNGKVCFSIEVYEETIEDVVYAKYKRTILKKYSNGQFYIESITEIGEKDFHFEAIVPDNYTLFESTKTIKRERVEQRDEECSPEVQEKYKKTGDLNSIRETSDW